MEHELVISRTLATIPCHDISGVVEQLGEGVTDFEGHRRLTMPLTLDDAARVVEGAIAKGGELKISIAVVVGDAGSRIIASPSGMIAGLVSHFVGRFTGRWDAHWLAAASFAVFAVSYFRRAEYTANASLGCW